MASSAKYAFIGDKESRKNPILRNIRSDLGLNSEFEAILSAQKNDISMPQIFGGEIAHEHPFCRIDLIKDINGNFRIAEIEVDKIHGFGYTTLCRQLSLNPIGTGLVNTMLDISIDKPTGILLSGSERFYIPELTFFAHKVNAFGGNVVVVPEDNLIVTDDSVFASNMFGTNKLRIEQLVSIPTQLRNRGIANGVESALLEHHKVHVLSKPFKALGEKVTLALIHNLQQNGELEAILNTCFSQDALNFLRGVIPRTEFLAHASKEHKNDLAELVRNRSLDFFVKVVDQSGARGIGEPGNIDKQLELITGKLSKKVIIQQAIVPEILELSHINLLTGERGNNNFSVRYSLFVSGQGEVLDLGLTASPGIVAHGGVNSIQLGHNIQL